MFGGHGWEEELRNGTQLRSRSVCSLAANMIRRETPNVLTDAYEQVSLSTTDLGVIFDVLLDALEVVCSDCDMVNMRNAKWRRSVTYFARGGAQQL